MYATKEKFARNTIYETIQVTIAKLEDSDGNLFFKMSSKLEITKYKINLIELGGEAVKLVNLVNQVVIKGLIRYRGIDFLLYPPYYPTKYKVFQPLLGF